MKHANIFRAWSRILSGSHPSLSIEITRECPLPSPGCYAYEPRRLGDLGPLRSLGDFRGQASIDGVLDLVREHPPIYVSIVGGEPLVRLRELESLLPRLSRMGVTVQLVTGAVHPIPPGWKQIPGLRVVVSMDGLLPDHDARRTPATYERILKNIEGHSINVHCTVTRQMARRAGSFGQFVAFWSSRREVRQIWFSLFTPQRGELSEEVLPAPDRARVLDELAGLRQEFPKLNLPDAVIEGYRHPPASPADCIFARTTLSVTADLRSRIAPCQFGGDPDCSQCGCLASAAAKTVGAYRVLGILPLRTVYEVSDRIGQIARRRERRAADP